MTHDTTERRAAGKLRSNQSRGRTENAGRTVAGEHRPLAPWTPLRHQLLATVEDPAVPVQTFMESPDENPIGWRVDGATVHGSITQSLNRLRKAGLIVEAASKPFSWLEARDVSLTDPGRAALEQWTREGRKPAPEVRLR